MRKAVLAVVVLCAGEAHAEEVVIAALGDSLTQGFGLQVDDGLVPQLQAWLDAQGADVRLINAGVSGDTTAGGLARVAWTLTPEVDGMIVALGGNDLLRGLDPAQARANLSGILDAAQAAQVDVMLVGMQAPGNYGPDYKAQFDAIYPELAAQYGALYQRSLFDGLADGPELPNLLEVQSYFQADGIHPNADGVARIVEGIGPTVMELVTKAAD